MIEPGTRRGFLIGALALMAAPAIVRADSLIKIAPGPIRVWASNQSGNTLTVEPLSHALNLGDIVTIDDVFAWHRLDNTPIRRLRQFVVVVRAEPGHRVVHLYPPIVGEHNPRYRTVVDYPMNKARVRVVLRVPVTFHEARTAEIVL